MHRFITIISLRVGYNNIINSITVLKRTYGYECCLPLHLFVFLSKIAFVEIMLPYLKKTEQ